MRKVLILAAALVPWAVPASAQRDAATPGPAATARPVAVPTASPVQSSAESTPTLQVSTEEIRAHVRQAEEARREADAQVGNHAWWILVAAIAVGVIIALIVAG